MRQKTRARLETVDLIQIRVGSYGREMHDLIEAVLQARCLGVEEDEAQRIHLFLEAPG
jgi:hypothetical protein